MLEGALKQRVEALLARIDLVSLVGASVDLSRGHNPRGKCPFHGSKSESLAVYPDSGRFRCWGCGEGGDAIKFVTLMFGLSFIDALKQLESQNGLDGLTAAPAKREKRERPRRARAPIDSAAMGRILWREAAFDGDALRTYLAARGVPEAVLTDKRLAELRFHPSAPIAAWPEGERDRVPTAPAMLARVRSLPDCKPVAVHATWLAPDLRSKMLRLGRGGDPLPSRKFLGPVAGGGVLFVRNGKPAIDDLAPLFAAEGIETLLSGMALVEAPAEAIGLALLSLENLQGGWRAIGKARALPLHDPEPDPDRAGVAFAHEGLVIGLIDADMKPIRGPIDRETGEPRGVPVIERPGGRVTYRELRSAERSQLCAALFVRSWRRAGCRCVQSMRPPMGQDFNDLAAHRGSQTFRGAIDA